MECLDPKLFRKLDIASACITELDVDLPSIDRYVSVLKYLNVISLQTEKMDIESIQFVRRRVTIEAFFQDHLGRYLDEPALLQQFKQEAFALLKRYEQLEHEKLGVAGYNARMLKSLFLTIANVADILRHYSTHR